MTEAGGDGAVGRGLPRPIDAALAAAGLLALSPLLLAIAVAVRRGSPGPVLYRQQRVGRHGEPFALLKFRTMRVGADREGLLTVGDDTRITRSGSFLRRHKLDELPQLVNVVRGDMSLVGARPELPTFVLAGVPDQELVLRTRPGLTDPASLAFTGEADVLARADDPAEHYRRHVLPAKLALSADYARRRTAGSDVGVLLRTAGVVLAPARAAPLGRGARPRAASSRR